MDIRRVVTGHDDDGRAVVTDDAVVDPVTLTLLPGFGTFELWHTDATPEVGRRVDGGSPGLGEPGAPRYFPPTGGSVLRVVCFPPDAGGMYDDDFDLVAALDEAQATLPDLVAKLEPDHPGMHTTDSVDYGIVLAGEIHLELDDGARTPCGPGTIVVQRATRHAWRNLGTEPAYVAFVVLGAEPPA